MERQINTDVDDKKFVDYPENGKVIL